MMQHARVLVHGSHKAVTPGPDRPVPLSLFRTVAPAADHGAQEISTTTSRRVRRHDFLRAVQWAIGSGLWPRANHTTARIAEDLARRMNADGHVAYGRLALAKRLKVSRRTVDRHVALLREIGLLAWVVHGSRTNTRPCHLPGWSGTATIYAATAPPAWDTAMGHRIRGSGYQARLVGFTPDGRRLAITDARRRGHSKQAAPIRTHSRMAFQRTMRDTPSCRENPLRPAAKVERGIRTTPRASRSSSTSSAAAATAVAAWVRPRVPWTQAESLRRLAFALRPWIEAGLSGGEIVDDLSSWWLSWRPRQPAAYLLSRWHTRQQQTPRHAPT
ncbi:helix-turn-helix domain-containing protein, partial [Streptomyces kanamyceticus]